MADYIYMLCDTWIDKGLKFLRTKCQENIPSMDINIVTSLCCLMQALLQPSRGVNVNLSILKEGELDETVMANLSRIFGWACIWSIGGNIDHKSIEGFDVFFRTEFETLTIFPGSDTVYEYFVNVKDQVFLFLFLFRSLFKYLIFILLCGVNLMFLYTYTHKNMCFLSKFYFL